MIFPSYKSITSPQIFKPLNELKFNKNTYSCQSVDPMHSYIPQQPNIAVAPKNVAKNFDYNTITTPPMNIDKI